MQLFYSKLIQNDSILLDAEESAHALRVLRKAIGDVLFVTDGLGNLFEAEIESLNAKSAQLKIIQVKNFSARSKRLHIAISPTKNIDRFEWFLEKACEFGIEEITPIICQRSERKIIKPERLEKILIAGMKQSLHYYLPQLNDTITFSNFLKQSFDPDFNLAIAHCIDGNKLKLNSLTQKHNLVLIGPEGDFSLDEIKMAQEKSFQSITLGDFRLRTETAGIAVAHEHALMLIA